jgi:hypothetical protein
MMQVNNKFNIGDKVFFIDNKSKAKCDEVMGIVISVNANRTRVSYTLKEAAPCVDEEQAFATESDLRKHVLNDLIESV